MTAFPDADLILADLQTRIESGVPALVGKIVYPEPDEGPQEVTVYLSYGPLDIAWDGMETVSHTLSIVVCVPRSGPFKELTQLINTYVRQIYQSLKLGIVLADELVIVGPFRIDTAGKGTYAPGNTAVVSGSVSFQAQSLEGNEYVQSYPTP